MKILVADDSKLWRDRIKTGFRTVTNDIVIYEAENGVEALRIIKENVPDLAILDIRMPEMNGIEVLMKIRKLKMDVKVCILTCYPYPQYKKRCMEVGADFFLSKTEDFEEIEMIASNILPAGIHRIPDHNKT